MRLAAEQLAERGVQLTGAAARGIAERYVLWSGQSRVVETRAPAASAGAEGELQAIIKAVMSSMLIFFVFFTGASAAQSLVTEHEEGTLARLAATPTRAAAIIAGKSLSAVVLLVVQVAVLLLASAVLFGIRWGKPGPLAVSAVSLILAASGFGLLLMGLVRSSRQVGLVLGMGLSVTGMLGGLFTHFIPGIPSYLDLASLAVPQGWAVRLWKLTLAGAPLLELLPSAGVLAGIGILCFAAGVLLQRRRFA